MEKASEQSTISERLREERQRLGLSQDGLASSGGVTRRSQGLYETGERTPGAAYLAKIADAGVDVVYVLTGKSDAARQRKERTVLALLEDVPAISGREKGTLADDLRRLLGYSDSAAHGAEDVALLTEVIERVESAAMDHGLPASARARIIAMTYRAALRQGGELDPQFVTQAVELARH